MLPVKACLLPDFAGSVCNQLWKVYSTYEPHHNCLIGGQEPSDLGHNALGTIKIFSEVGIRESITKLNFDEVGNKVVFKKNGWLNVLP